MTPSSSLMSSKRSGAAALAPLPYLSSSAWPTRGVTCFWRPAKMPVGDVAALRGSWMLAETPQAYKALLEASSPLRYVLQQEFYSHDWKLSAGLFLVCLLVVPSSLLVMSMSLSFFLPGLMISLLVTVGSIMYVESSTLQALPRLLRERPLLEAEYASLQEARRRLPSSPLAPLYEAWSSTSDADTRQEIEGLWASLVKEERRRVLEAQKGEREALQRELQAKERPQVEARKALVQALKEEAEARSAPLIPLAGGPQVGVSLQDQVPHRS